MAAGLGFKTFATGDVLSAADVNGYLMQGVLVFASAAARDAAITSPQEGQFAYLKDTNVTTYYTGSAWTNLDTTGMVNPMTTTGDTIYSSSGSTPARLGIGSTGQVLTVAAGVPTWATAGGGSGLTLIQRSSFSAVSNTSTTFDGVFTSTYKTYRIAFEAISSSDAPPVTLYWQWRKSGPSTHSTAYYAGSSRVNFNGAETLAGNSNASQYSLDSIGNTASNAYSFDVYRVGQGTSVNPLIYGMGTGYSGNIGPFTFGGTLDSTINTTGFILSASAGTITGTVAIYGLATA
jgi:hypothetical protein